MEKVLEKKLKEKILKKETILRLLDQEKCRNSKIS